MAPLQSYSVALLGDQATVTIILFSTQKPYPDTKLTSPCPIPVMLSARVDSDYIVGHPFDSNRIGTSDILHGKPALYRFDHHNWYGTRHGDI